MKNGRQSATTPANQGMYKDLPARTIQLLCRKRISLVVESNVAHLSVIRNTAGTQTLLTTTRSQPGTDTFAGFLSKVSPIS